MDSVRTIKSYVTASGICSYHRILRRMKCVGNVAHLGTKQNTCSDLVVKFKEEDNLEDIGVDGFIILKSVLKLGWKSLDYNHFADRNTWGIL